MEDRLPASGPSDDNLSGLSKYTQVQSIAKRILSENGAKSEDKTLPGRQILEQSKKKYPDIDIPENTFLQYLSNSVRDPKSQINSQGRRKGYYLTEIAEVVAKLEDEGLESEFTETPKPAELEKEKVRVEKEKLLYPLLVNWLQEQGYQSKDTSAGKKGGRWGNPDVTGVLPIEHYQSIVLELATIEVKSSLEGWEQWIFEAVSHRRFANRAYFAFAHPSETINKLPSEMRYYSELYGVGILIVGLSNEAFSELIGGKLEEPIALDEADILEVYSAPFSYVQPQYQTKYCEAINTKSAKDLFAWGQGPMLDE